MALHVKVPTTRPDNPHNHSSLLRPHTTEGENLFYKLSFDLHTYIVISTHHRYPLFVARDF